jgi:tRNA-dihydrouridine synthase 1
MFHARLFAENAKYREQFFQSTKPLTHTKSALPDSVAQEPKPWLDGHPTIDRPLFVQFCANDPDVLLGAAKYVQPFCDAVDLNLGCPQGIARKGHYGAFLQEDWDLIYRLINKLHTELDVPITAKMRVLETREKTLEYAKTLLSAGASILTVHGRRREQKSHNTGIADWSMIRYLRDNLPPDTVIFANGNILQHEDIQRCLDVTGADGVMSAEGNLHDPSIFAPPPPVGQEGREYWRGRDGKGGYRMDAVLRRYLDIIYKYVLERPLPQREPLFLPSDPIPQTQPVSEETETATSDEPPRKKQKQEKGKRETSVNLSSMQAHLFNLLRPLVSEHHDIRDALARSRGRNIEAFETILRLVENAVRKGLLDYESSNSKEDALEELDAVQDKGNALVEDEESSAAAVARCKRPWWVCQSYIRPMPKEAIAKGAMQMSKKEKRELAAKESIKEETAAQTKSNQINGSIEALNDRLTAG